MFYGWIKIIYVLAWYIAVITNGKEFWCIGKHNISRLNVNYFDSAIKHCWLLLIYNRSIFCCVALCEQFLTSYYKLWYIAVITHRKIPSCFNAVTSAVMVEFTTMICFAGCVWSWRDWSLRCCPNIPNWPSVNCWQPL